MHLSRLLAVSHTRLGDHAAAEPHARAAMREGPDAELLFTLGVAAEARGEQEVALDHYETAISLEPRCWRAMFHVGKVAMQYGEYDTACEYFQQTAAVNPEHAPTAAFLARLKELGDDGIAWRTGAADEQGEDAPPPPDTPPLPDGLSDFEM